MIPFTGQAYYMIPTSGNLGGYIDAGLGFYMSRAKVEVSGSVPGYGSYSESDTESDTNLGINLGGGIKFGAPEKKMKFGADLKYHIVMTEGESTSLVSVFGRIYFE
jgi:opacity protein-like surface antigen